MPPVRNKNFQAETKKLSNNAVVFQHRERLTAAQLNTGLVSVLPPTPNFKYRLITANLIAIGAAVSGATDLRVSGVQGGNAAALMTVAIAALTKDALVGPTSANVTLLADGASFIEGDSGTGIAIQKTGGTLAGATAVDVLIVYALERG